MILLLPETYTFQNLVVSLFDSLCNLLQTTILIKSERDNLKFMEAVV